jgi:hypothetical protein
MFLKLRTISPQGSSHDVHALTGYVAVGRKGPFIASLSASSYGLPPPYADSALGGGHDRGDCQFVAPTSKRAELHSEAPGLLLVCLAL